MLFRSYGGATDQIEADAIVSTHDAANGLTTDPSDPRGIRNNNPGNIESGAEWEGLNADGTDTRFAQFDTPEHGIRALARTLTTYSTKHNLNTVAGIINRWAPNFENDTSSYAAAVASKLGVKPTDTIDVAANMPKLIKAIIKHENGEQPYSDMVINKGIEMSK